MSGSVPFVEALRAELVAAAAREIEDRRRRRRRRPRVVAAVAALLTAVVGGLALASLASPAAADVVVRVRGGEVVVTLEDLEHRPARIEAAVRQVDLDVSVRAVPVGPSNVGRFVGQESSGPLPAGFRTLDAAAGSFRGFALPPEGWPGSLHLLVGRPARGDEPYAVFSDALAPEEPLACQGLVGQRVADAAPRLFALEVEVLFDAIDDRQPIHLVPREVTAPRLARLGGVGGRQHRSALGGGPHRTAHPVSRCAQRHAALPTLSAHQRDAPRLVHLDLLDTAVRFAFSFAVEQSGWSRSTSPAAHVAHVADRVTSRPDLPPLDVLVITPTPGSSRRAMDAFTDGRVRAIVSTTDPQSLPTVLEGARHGLSVVSTEIVEAAARFPVLSTRLEHTLRLIVRGRINRDISRELQHSEATTKRDVADLLRRFDVDNRVALAATALRLGLPPDGRA